VYIEQKELLEDPQKEKSRLEKQAQKLEKEVLKLAGRLKSKGFVDKAPEDVVLKARGELKELEDQFGKVTTRLDELLL